MATIRKKGEFQWHCQVRKKGFPHQTATFNTKKEAEAWASVVESEMVRGVFVNRSEAEKTTLGEALERYLSEVTPSKKGATREAQRIRAWQRDPLAMRSLAGIRGTDLAKYRDACKASGSSDATIRLNLMVISALFETCRKEWGMEGLANPCRNVKMPSGSKPRDRRLEGDEEGRLLAELDQHCRNHFIPALVRFSIETAARRGELVNLLWKHVDLKSRKATLLDTKTGDDRTIPLSSRAIEILESLPRSLTGRVFPVGKDAVTRAVASARKRAGIDDLRLHDLRHEATSRLFEKGLNQMEAASVTGHKTLQMLGRYTHLRAEDLAKKLG